jgi:hypothetical protein
LSNGNCIRSTQKEGRGGDFYFEKRRGLEKKSESFEVVCDERDGRAPADSLSPRRDAIREALLEDCAP